MADIHPLKQYLERNQITQRDFSFKINYAEQNLNKILSGKFKPSICTASKIVKATNGEISYEDLAGIMEEY
ncbi:MAG: helix-turn-helix domain-containing protein [Metallibacterium sp.]